MRSDSHQGTSTVSRIPCSGSVDGKGSHLPSASQDMLSPPKIAQILRKHTVLWRIVNTTESNVVYIFGLSMSSLGSLRDLERHIEDTNLRPHYPSLNTGHLRWNGVFCHYLQPLPQTAYTIRCCSCACRKACSACHSRLFGELPCSTGSLLAEHKCIEVFPDMTSSNTYRAFSVKETAVSYVLLGHLYRVNDFPAAHRWAIQASPSWQPWVLVRDCLENIVSY